MRRLVDIIISSSGIVLLLPLFIIIMSVICLTIGRPIFFVQARPGLHGKIFKLIKFRTMSNLKDSKGSLLPDHKRLTRFGLFIRSLSLDELPSLFNVFLGNMSIIGPRPLLIEYLPLYNKNQSRRHEIKPGITGWAQVNGRNDIQWDKRLELDVWYVDNHSLLLDIKIIFLTIKKVVFREGIMKGKKETMPKFKGSTK
tara:strand:+ start:9291 stop:9884 length:594 start_codon:yes stop_codon:yes gene_type:complete